MAFGCSRALILPLAVTVTVGTAAAQNENFLDRMFVGPQRQHQYVPQQAIPFRSDETVRAMAPPAHFAELAGLLAFFARMTKAARGASLRFRPRNPQATAGSER